MRRLLTGYAITFNRRHRRIGHLFQNRYKSIVCEEDPYFRELIRYIHLNPLRAGLVPDLRRLEWYPWGGHAALLGRVPQPWLDVGAVLPWFGPTPTQARRAYRRYVAEGVPLGRRPELVGGGLIRSAGGWAVVQAWRRLGAATAADPQILGTGDFVQRVIAEAEAQRRPQPGVRRRPQAAARLIRAVSTRAGIGEAELRTGSRRRPVAQRRVEVARTLVRTLGFSLADAARELGVSTSAICRALQKPGDK
jgi:putative transposase